MESLLSNTSAIIYIGGQILVNSTAWTEVQRSQLTPCVSNDTGRHKVEGNEKKIRLIEVIVCGAV